MIDDTVASRPTFLTIQEAAQVLRISRSSAYEHANAWLRTDGQSGIPCIRLGRRLVVPIAALESWAATGTGTDTRP